MLNYYFKKTYPDIGAILSTKARLKQNPAPPVANQNAVFLNKNNN